MWKLQWERTSTNLRTQRVIMTSSIKSSSTYMHSKLLYNTRPSILLEYPPEKFSMVGGSGRIYTERIQMAYARASLNMLLGEDLKPL